MCVSLCVYLIVCLCLHAFIGLLSIQTCLQTLSLHLINIYFYIFPSHLLHRVETASQRETQYKHRSENRASLQPEQSQPKSKCKPTKPKQRGHNMEPCLHQSHYNPPCLLALLTGVVIRSYKRHISFLLQVPSPNSIPLRGRHSQSVLPSVA